MSGEKKPVLVATSGVLRLDDVQQSRNCHFDTVDQKGPALVPHRLEVSEAGHDERQIDLEVAGASSFHDRTSLNQSLREPSIARGIERLLACPQLEGGRFTRLPTSDQIVWIRRQEQVAVLRREDGRATERVVVCAAYAYQHIANGTLVQGAGKRNERIHTLSKLLRVLIVIPKRLVHP